MCWLTDTHIWLRMSSWLCATNGLSWAFWGGWSRPWLLPLNTVQIHDFSWVVVPYDFDSSTQEAKAGRFLLSSRTAWSTAWIPQQPRLLFRETLSWGKKIHQYTWPVAAQMVCPGHPWLAKHNSYVCLSSQNSKPVTLSVCSGCCVKTQWTGYLISQSSGSPESKFKELANWIPGEGPVPGLPSCLLSLVEGGNSGVSLRKTQKPSLEPHPQGLIAT